MISYDFDELEAAARTLIRHADALKDARYAAGSPTVPGIAATATFDDVFGALIGAVARLRAGSTARLRDHAAALRAARDDALDLEAEFATALRALLARV